MCIDTNGDIFAAKPDKNQAPVYDSSVDKKRVVAQIGDTNITLEEIDMKKAVSIYGLQNDIYNVRSDILADRVLELEAAKKETTVESYLKITIDEKLKIKPEAVRAYFDQNPQYFQGRTFDQMKRDIERFLKNNKRRSEFEKLKKKLQRDYKVVNNIPRPIPVAVQSNSQLQIIKGNIFAKTKIHEFIDLACSYCKEAYHNLTKYLVDNPDINIEIQLYPAKNNQQSYQASLAATCAAKQNKFADYLDVLFKKQNRYSDDDLKKYAGQAKLNVDEFNQCFNSQETKSIVDESIEIAKKIGVERTPTIFLNGYIHVGPIQAEQIDYYLNN